MKLLLYTPLRHIRGVEVGLHSFLTSAGGGAEWLISHPDRCNPGMNPAVRAE